MILLLYPGKLIWYLLYHESIKNDKKVDVREGNDLYYYSDEARIAFWRVVRVV
jgi:hypothetical protein